ncbi:MAG: ABC transporter substrate-binding protein [Gloeomargarita sp. SKYG116]|nr:ABC transporter substrate-binding protein [Gloeomargarita sp. SKYG116]MDW8400640.1 ABC transporter substrate-binding protein [Gloeomargarita sp. SKYGB_i_bin116]
MLSLLLAVSCGPANVTSDDVVVRLGFSAWPGWFPWQVAQEKGIFQKHNVRVELQWFDSYTDSMNALKAEQLDANSQTLNDTISAVAGGADQVIVLVNDNSTGNDQIIVREGINTLADLKGKKLAAEEGSVSHFFLSLVLERAGLTLQDITFVPLETGKAAAAFAAGQVDGVAVFAPFTTQALKRPASKVLTSSKDFPGAVSDHLVFTRRFVEQHPQQVQKVVDAWFDTLKYIQEHPDESVAIMAKQANVTVAEYKQYATGTRIFNAQENVAAFQPGKDMTSLPFAAQKVSAFLVQTGLAKNQPDVSRLFDDQFVKTYVAQAQ